MEFGNRSNPGPAESPVARFGTTVWSKILRAAAPDDPDAKPALAALCQAYWYPLYAFVRRRGSRSAEAEDSVQSFFAWLLEKNILQYADPERGRFRGFLVAAFRQFLARRHEYESAAKRKPPEAIVSIDVEVGAERFAREMTETATPELMYEYAWAVAVLRRAIDRIREEYEADGRGDRFQAFEGVLTGQSALTSREMGTMLGLSEGAVRVAIHRFRQQVRDRVRDEVAATVENEADVDDELRNLHATLKKGGA